MSETLSETFDMVMVKSVLLNARGRQSRHQHTSNVNSPVLQAGRAGHAKDMDCLQAQDTLKACAYVGHKIREFKNKRQQDKNFHFQQ